jgi:hypothetical protein
MRPSALLVCLALVFSQPPLVESQRLELWQRLADSDGDGLNDELEQSLLVKFAPIFLIGRQECSASPAEFARDVNVPSVKAENGTIYGQAFPAKTLVSEGRTVEIHFYHLWQQDCGAHSHPLDAEHVSALVRASGLDGSAVQWRALYWYAAAHEATVCDVSQIARAITLNAEDRGAKVWISPGKHASFLDPALCHRGCGRDRCEEEMKPFTVRQIVNLGEIEKPMNGSLWTSSSSWPLAAKMTGSDFPSAPIARLETLPPTNIAWFNPGRHPAQGVIAISDSTADAIGTSGDNTFTAISVAGDSTGNALQKSYRKTADAIGTAGRHVGNALRPKSKPTKKSPQNSFRGVIINDIRCRPCVPSH